MCEFPKSSCYLLISWSHLEYLEIDLYVDLDVVNPGSDLPEAYFGLFITEGTSVANVPTFIARIE